MSERNGVPNDVPDETEAPPQLVEPVNKYLKMPNFHRLRKKWPPKGSTGGSAAGSPERPRT